MEKTAFIIYSIVLIVSVLLFGAVHTYAYTFMTLGVLIGSLVLLKKCIKKNMKSGVYELQLPASSLYFAFFILLVFIFLQTVPLPDFLIKFISPESLVVFVIFLSVLLSSF